MSRSAHAGGAPESSARLINVLGAKREEDTMKLVASMVATVLVLSAAPMVAQQEKGDTELQIAGQLSFGGVADTGAVVFNWGRFVTDSQEFGLTLVGLLSSFGGDEDFLGYGGPFWRANFGSGTTVPYVGVAAATSFGDFGSGDLILSFEAGARWFLRRNVAFNVAGTNYYDVDASEFGDEITVIFGFSYLWQ